MNLIEISEQLKDVPDQLLLKEVQAPSGAFPAYLVVTEMGRRKRMREQAMKQAPTTTVAQDLAQIQQPPQPQAQQMSQQPQAAPQAPRVNAGIMAAPQARGSLAAQDVEPVGMAGGGMVAFAGGGDVQRFQNTGLVGEFDVGIGPDIERRRRLTNEEVNAIADALRAQGRNLDIGTMKDIQEGRIGMPSAPISTRPVVQTAPSPAALQTPAVPMAAPAVASAAAPMPRLNLPSAPQPYQHKDIEVPYQTQATRLLANLEAMKEQTPEERAAARTRGAEAYQQAVPFRMGFMEQEIANRGKALEGRRDSNINEAIMQAGLGIMGSKSPRFLQAAGEAGASGLNAYRQGLKEIREGERELMQSRVSYANAQSLYDQGKFAAGQAEESKAEAQNDRALRKLQANAGIIQNMQQSALMAQNINQQGRAAEATTGIASYKARLEAAELPYKAQLMGAQAKYYAEGGGRSANTQARLTDADQKAAEDFARTRALITTGKPIGSPEYQAAFNQLYREELIRRAAGVNYNPQTPGAVQAAPALRNPTAPLGAQ